MLNWIPSNSRRGSKSPMTFRVEMEGSASPSPATPAGVAEKNSGTFPIPRETAERIAYE